jgi:hypothetical protein
MDGVGGAQLNSTTMVERMFMVMKGEQKRPVRAAKRNLRDVEKIIQDVSNCWAGNTFGIIYFWTPGFDLSSREVKTRLFFDDRSFLKRRLQIKNKLSRQPIYFWQPTTISSVIFGLTHCLSKKEKTVATINFESNKRFSLGHQNSQSIVALAQKFSCYKFLPKRELSNKF